MNVAKNTVIVVATLIGIFVGIPAVVGVAIGVGIVPALIMLAAVGFLYSVIWIGEERKRQSEPLSPEPRRVERPEPGDGTYTDAEISVALRKLEVAQKRDPSVSVFSLFSYLDGTAPQ